MTQTPPSKRVGQPHHFHDEVDEGIVWRSEGKEPEVSPLKGALRTRGTLTLIRCHKKERTSSRNLIFFRGNLGFLYLDAFAAPKKRERNGGRIKRNKKIGIEEENIKIIQ